MASDDGGFGACCVGVGRRWNPCCLRFGGAFCVLVLFSCVGLSLRASGTVAAGASAGGRVPVRAPLSLCLAMFAGRTLNRPVSESQQRGVAVAVLFFSNLVHSRHPFSLSLSRRFPVHSKTKPVQVTPPAVLEGQPVQFISTRPSFRGPPSSSPLPPPGPPAAAAGAAPGRSGGSANSTASAAGGGSGRGGKRGGSGKGGRGGRGGGGGDADGAGGGGAGGGGAGAGGGAGSDGTELGELATVAAQRTYDFSLAGILKSAESSGYRIVDPQVCVCCCTCARLRERKGGCTYGRSRCCVVLCCVHEFTAIRSV